MNILTEYACTKLNIKKSKFLAELFPLQTQEEAGFLLKEQKKKYHDASHVVHAFVLGSTGGILGCSDDGEPSGTAGKPALSVLKGSGITGILLTITRWFGGTLLGSGGLVKAYSGSAKAVLEKAKTEPLIEKSRFELLCPYSDYEILKQHLADFSIKTEHIEFGESVTLTGVFPAEEKTALSAFVENTAKGSKTVKLLIFP